MAFNKKNALNRARFIKVDSKADVYQFSDALLKGTPLVLNFEKTDAEAANHFIVFLSGIVYAMDGMVEMLSKKIFVFASKKDLKDKALRGFIEDNKESEA